MIGLKNKLNYLKLQIKSYLSDDPVCATLAVISNLAVVSACIMWVNSGSWIIAISWLVFWSFIQFVSWQQRLEREKILRELSTLRRQAESYQVVIHEFSKLQRAQLTQCKNCKFYYGNHNIICAVHPDGVETEVCADWQQGD